MNKTPIHKLPFAERLAYHEKRYKELKMRIRKLNEDIQTKRISEKIARGRVRTLHLGLRHHSEVLVGMRGEHKV